MERYFLFRGDELIYSCDENAKGSMGAGNAHRLGQDGDVLICSHRGGLRGWNWNQPGVQRDSMPWLDIRPEKLDTNKYRVLLMLQQ